MAIELKKGNRISLKKEAPGLQKVMLGLGWDMVEAPSGGLFGLFKKTAAAIDLDAGVLCLNDQGKLTGASDFIYYANLKHKSGAIAHQGDNLTGEGEGDDEQIFVDLDLVPTTIQTLLFAVIIYQGRQRNQEFSQIKNAFVRLVDLSNNREIAHYQLSGATYQGKTGMLMAELRREENGWAMAALGEGLDPQFSENLLKKYL
ncbi:TerD family protein [Picosynechococcus sp. NKBG15041c]|uniref:TerD family protein n=1 Tax=Picosynechococcus sp. NKBG15041c TaxID=1407650 RepID=UPI0003F7D1BE|nr:TerD family protein [Picosynechococcus sp. NKBG15041c]